MWQSPLRRHDSYLGFILERRKPEQSVKGKDQAGNACKAITNICSGGGSIRSIDEYYVMGWERRG